MSVDTYTVAAVETSPREVKLDHGTFLSYRFKCEGHGEKVFSLLQKPESPAPKPGDRFEADVKNVFKNDDGSEVTNLKRIQQQRGGGSNGPRPEDPARAKRIMRQHSQEMALRYATIRQAQGKLPDTFSLEDLFKIADRFDADGAAAA